MKNIKNVLKISVLLILVLVGANSARGEGGTSVNLTVRDGATVVFSGTVPLQPAGTINLNDSAGNPHSLEANSVLSVLHDADTGDDSWSVSDLQYFESFGSFLVNCIQSSVGNDCFNWQYAVGSLSPGIGMDKTTLSGGENVFVYFGPQNRVSLGASSIATNDSLTVITQKYNYEDNTWTTRTQVSDTTTSLPTVGLTQPNPDDPFSPIEIQTSTVNTDGEAVFLSIPAGSYNVGVKEDFYFPTEALTVTTPPQGGHNSHSSSSTTDAGSVLGAQTKVTFDLKKAFDFLITKQKDDGSFVGDLYTDWTSIALGSTPNYKNETIKLIKHFVESKMESPLVTDYERHSMALMALGLNPYNTNGENYIKKITDSFDGTQFGDLHEDNDDIFALIVLQNTGYGAEDKMIEDGIGFVLRAQNDNGSWDNSVDMTGAAMQALSPFSKNAQIKFALTKAKEFLQRNQEDTGGWNKNASSTAWAIGGIAVLGEKPGDWIKGNNNTPSDYLALLQDSDGGIKDEDMNTKIWETAYVTSALSGKTWSQIMQKFDKQIIVTESIPPKSPAPAPLEKVAIKKTKPASVNIEKAHTEDPKNNDSIQNTANAIEATPAPEDNAQKSWFTKLLESIFGY